MPDWPQLLLTLKHTVRQFVGLIKRRRREELPIALAALFFWFGFSFSGFLPSELKAWVETWQGLLIVEAACYLGGLLLLVYGIYRIWRLVAPPELPLVVGGPAAIKGPMAFTREDGPLFRKLGREDELEKLLGWIQDDQIQLVVVMGASGAGKSSLLRAGLADILKDKEIDYHYWEAVPTKPGAGLLRVLQESWNTRPRNSPRQQEGEQHSTEAQCNLPKSLDDLVNPSAELCPRNRVIVLDQFEQLHGQNHSRCPVFRLLRKVAREARPPRRVTWIVAFRREFRADWSDFMIPEYERHFFAPELSVQLFSEKQAKDVVYRLVNEASLSVEQKVVDNLIEAVTVKGEVSPVDIGVGLQVLADRHRHQAGQTVTIHDYHFAGGAEGLLTGYISKQLRSFGEGQRQEASWVTFRRFLFAWQGLRPGKHLFGRSFL